MIRIVKHHNNRGFEKTGIMLVSATIILLVVGLYFFTSREAVSPVQPNENVEISSQNEKNEQAEKAAQETTTPPPVTETIDTSNWKTYRNEQYGFEVRYPQDWNVEEDYARAGNSFLFIDSKQETPFLVQVFPRFDKQKSLEELIPDYVGEKDAVVEHLKLQSYDAVLIRHRVGSPPFSDWDNFILTTHNGVDYTLPHPIALSYFPKYKEIQILILSTFKFIP